MKQFKRLLSVLITITLIFGLIAVPTFAVRSLKYEDEAKVLNQLGLFKGVSEKEYKPNLEAKLLREEAVALLLRMFGLEDEALKMDEKEATNILKRFKDADKIATWAIKYIGYAVENKVIVGRPDGNFAPKDNLLGREYSKMILAMLGYVQGIDFQYEFSTAEFCSATGFSQTEAAKLDTETILRDDVVGMSFFALLAEYVAGENEGVTVIEAIVGNDEDLKEIAINAGLIEEAVIVSVESLDDIEVKVGEWLRLPSTVRAVYSDGKVANVQVTWPAVDTSKAKPKTQITGVIEGTDIEAKVNVTIKEDVLKVDSVIADNLKEIYVVYNKDVSNDAAVAEKDNYKLNISNPISTVRVDGNTAILIVTNDIDNQKKAKLTISDKILGAKEEIEFTFFDATLPEVVSLDITGPKSVNIIFSEPIKKNGKITLKSGNSTLSVNTTFKGYGTSVISVPLYSTFANGKSYEITIRDFEDYAGYKNIIRTIEFVYEKDDTPPIVTVDTVRQEYVKVTFNKPVKGLTPNHFSHTFTAWKAMSLTKTDTYIDPAKEPNNENLVKPTESVKEVYAWFYHDGKKKELERPIHEGTTSFRVIAKSGDYIIKDEWGNTLEELNVSITVTADRTAPEVTEIEVISENEIKIKFSKSVEFSKDNIEVLDTNGEKIDGVRLTVVNPGIGKEFNVKLRKDLTGTAILVNIRNVEDASLYANKMYPYSEVIEIDDKTAPKITMVTYNDARYSSGRFIEAGLYVFFNEPLDADSALKSSNYYIYDGSSYTKLTGTSTFISGEKTVRIELTEKQYDKIKSIAKITGKGLFVVGVKDISGNEIEPRIKTIDGSQDDANIPSIKKETVKATSPDTIELVFNQELASVSHNAFRVVTNDTDKSYTVIGMKVDLEDGNTKVSLTVEGEKRVDGRRVAIGLPYDAKGIKLDFIGKEVENYFGIKGNNEYDIGIADKISPEVEKIAAASTDRKINITFTEELDSKYVSMYVLDLIITDEDENELVEGIDFTTALSPTNSKILEVTIKKGGYGKYFVSSVENPERIMDLKGNLMVKFSKEEVTLTDRVAPSVTKFIEEDIASGKTATVEFSKEPNATSKVKVESAIQNANKAGGTLGFSWNLSGKILTVINNTGVTTNFKGDKESVEVKVMVIDITGNGSDLTIIKLGDTTAPSLVSGKIVNEIEAGSSVNLVFSEALKDESKTAVENAIRSATSKGTIEFTWTNDGTKTKLTVKNTSVTEATNFKGAAESAKVGVKVSDLSGNESTITVINILDTTAPSLVSSAISDEIGTNGFADLTFSEALKDESIIVVENAIRSATSKGTIGFTWTNDGTKTKLTVKNTSATEATNFKGAAESAKVEVKVSDLSGNESTITVINILDTTAPSLVSYPIVRELGKEGSGTDSVALAFSEKLAEGSKTDIQNKITSARTTGNLSFLWSEDGLILTVKNTSISETNSTNFAGTLTDNKIVKVKIKDLANNSTEVTIINIPTTTITGEITSELEVGAGNEFTVNFLQGENAANISLDEINEVITAIKNAAGEGAKDLDISNTDNFEKIAGSEPGKYSGVKMKSTKLTATTTFAQAGSPIIIPLDIKDVNTAKSIFILTINIPVQNP